MKITSVSLRRPVTVLICTAALVFFGLSALFSMGMQRIPDIDFPIVSVTTTMTGASATIMDNDVADPIEEKLSSISGVKNITSTSYQGVSTTAVEFELEKDVDAAAADVRDKVNLAAADLPDEANTPVVQKFSSSDQAIVSIAVTGTMPYRERAEYADKVLKSRLESVDGVGNVSTPGLREREIRVWLDPAKLKARGLTVNDVSAAIKKRHVDLPSGSVKTERNEFQLRLNAEYSSVDELRTLPVLVKEGAAVRLGDVARVEDGLEDRSSVAMYNGEETILLNIARQRGTNEVTVADNILRRVEELKQSAPEGVEIKILANTSDFIRRSMKGVGSDIALAVGLCALIMLFFLQTLRATFVTVITIPVCLLGSFLFLKAFGVTINNLSMMGISLSVGMVVDATTVVLENIHRRMGTGIRPLEASGQGTDEVAFSVIAGGLTTVAVFAPITFMGGIIGKFFFSFGITVVCTIVISVLLSLSLTPFISSRIMRTEESGLLPARMIRSFLVSLENGYRRLLAMAVRFRWITLGGALGFFVLGLFFAANLGTSFFPSEDRGELTLSFELADGTALDESERFLARLDGIVRERKDVDYTYGTVAGGTGSEANKGSLYLSFVSRGERASLDEIKKELRREFERFPDAILSIAERGGSDITMNLSGGDIVQLGTTAAGILAELEGDARLTDVDTDVRLEKPQLNIRLNRARADDLDLDVRSLSEEISAYFGGLKAGVFKDGGYRYDIRLMAEDSLRTSGDDIEKISVFSGSGESVPLAGLVDVKRELAPNVVKRLNRQPSIEISANVSGISSGEGMAIISAAASKHLPADGSVSFGPSGQSQNMQEDFRRIFTAMATVVLLVYMVMAIQFESFMHPFTIMFCLPLLMPGAFGMLYLAGKSLDMMAFIGIILLVGIVVNNGIILVDFINQERKRGVPKAEAVVNAGPLRLRAILMTAFSTIVGAIPVALGISEGAELRQPMAIATVGGLATSTLLTLFVIPVVYLVLDDLKEKSASLVRWMRMGRTRRSVRGALEAAENIGGKS